MGIAFEITREDFAAACEVFNSKNFELMNVFSNRLMSNAVFGEPDDHIYAVIGFFLKDLALDFAKVGKESSISEEMQPFANLFLEGLDDAFKEQFDLKAAWEGYQKYVDSTRRLRMTDAEKASYKDNPEYTNRILGFLVNKILKSEEAIFHENSQAFKGIAGEAERLLKAHGILSKDLVLVSLISAMDRLYDYARFSCVSGSGQINLDLFKERIGPFVQEIAQFYENSNLSAEASYKAGSKILIKLIQEWRLYFVKFTELLRVGGSEERRIEIPMEAKKKIGETISQALRKDLLKAPEPKQKKKK